MKELKDKELKEVVGGVSIWVVLGAIAAAIFGVGIVDGYSRPLKCR